MTLSYQATAVPSSPQHRKDSAGFLAMLTCLATLGSAAWQESLQPSCQKVAVTFARPCVLWVLGGLCTADLLLQTNFGTNQIGSLLQEWAVSNAFDNNNPAKV